MKEKRRKLEEKKGRRKGGENLSSLGHVPGI